MKTSAQVHAARVLRAVAECMARPEGWFHGHLDVCGRCRERPFDLCEVGGHLLALDATETQRKVPSSPGLLALLAFVLELADTRRNRWGVASGDEVAHECRHHHTTLRGAAECALNTDVRAAPVLLRFSGGLLHHAPTEAEVFVRLRADPDALELARRWAESRVKGLTGGNVIEWLDGSKLEVREEGDECRTS